MSSTASDPASAQTIVLIHGMWMTPLSWEQWSSRYSDRGHRVLAPAWPGLEAEPEELRRDPTPLRNLSITDVVDHYDKIIRGLDQPPIIIGHSFGGLYTQLLLDRGLGAAGVTLGTGAPKGVLRLPFSTLRAAWPALGNLRSLTSTLRAWPVEIITARSITFWSSRMFPGQWYRHRASIAADGIVSMTLFIRLENCCVKCRTSSGTSPCRSRKGGT